MKTKCNWCRKTTKLELTYNVSGKKMCFKCNASYRKGLKFNQQTLTWSGQNPIYKKLYMIRWRRNNKDRLKSYSMQRKLSTIANLTCLRK